MKVAELLFEESYEEWVERKKNEPPPDPKAVIAKIKEDCQPFMRAGAPLLWRGMNLDSSMVKNISAGFHIGAVRNDRRPKDSDAGFHDALNDYFKKKVGLPLRSASLFASGNKSIAENYAVTEVVAVMPIGEFHYAWSRIIQDPWDDFSDNHWGEWKSKKLEKYIKDEAAALGFDDLLSMKLMSDPDAKRKILVNLLKKHGDTLYEFDNELLQAAKSGNEIMIVCDKFYIIEPYELKLNPKKLQALLSS